MKHQVQIIYGIDHINTRCLLELNEDGIRKLIVDSGFLFPRNFSSTLLQPAWLLLYFSLRILLKFIKICLVLDSCSWISCYLKFVYSFMSGLYSQPARLVEVWVFLHIHCSLFNISTLYFVYFMFFYVTSFFVWFLLWSIGLFIFLMRSMISF